MTVNSSINAERETSGSSSSTSRKCASSKTSRSWITLHSEARKRTSRTNLPAEHVQRVAAFSFDELSGSVEVSHREVEVVVFEAESAILLKVVARQPLLRGGVEGYYSKFVYTRAAPFSLRETGDAWWRHWHSYRGSSVQSADVVTESFRLEMVDLKTGASDAFYGQHIMRRYVEEISIVFVWNTYIEPSVLENEPVSARPSAATNTATRFHDMSESSR
ncbi:hypothetical protein PR002_g723 [Phytophthora rubi]|uniref:Uncharacterized protein n=1 Tax=Phytophthora rubi TaxID=129364 RepID=A0A6A3NTS2_9STRA|nr:hypothetical protein PR002_g723 [Phytophthora rubi]